MEVLGYAEAHEAEEAVKTLYQLELIDSHTYDKLLDKIEGNTEP